MEILALMLYPLALLILLLFDICWYQVHPMHYIQCTLFPWVHIMVKKVKAGFYIDFAYWFSLWVFEAGLSATKSDSS